MWLVELTNVILDRPAQALAFFGVLGIIIAVVAPIIRPSYTAPEGAIAVLGTITAGAVSYYYGKNGK